MVKPNTSAERSGVDTNNDSVHLIVFRLGEEDFGIPISQIKEVTITPPISRMPRTPKFIKGVTNIRGDIIAVMSLEERFKIKVSKNLRLPDEQTYTIVTEVENYTIGLLVNEVPYSLNVPRDHIEKTPQMIQEIIINEKYIDGIGKVEGSLIIVLNVPKILNSQEIKQLAI